MANEPRHLEGRYMINIPQICFVKICTSFILDSCMCMYVCVYVRESESEHGLGHLLWIHFICNVISPIETQCHHSQFGSVKPRNRTIGLRSVVFQLGVHCCFFINILKEYFTVSVLSQDCLNDCREVMMNLSK